MRSPFLPQVSFGPNKNAVTFVNSSTGTVYVSVARRSVSGGWDGVPVGGSKAFTRNDFEIVLVSVDGQTVADAAFIPPGSVYRYSGLSTELPLGFVLVPNQGALSHVTVENCSENQFSVQVTEGLSLGSEASSPVPPNSSTTRNRTTKELVVVSFFDGARVGILVSPGNTLVVSDHNNPWPVSPAPLISTSTLNILSFNIRYGSAQDQLNGWHYRRYIHRAIYSTHKPSIFGLQEALLFQRQQIAAAFPWYQSVGVGREWDLGGEATPIFYDPRIFMLRFSETYWLSETPNVPGSVTKSWGNNLSRIATMAHLVPNQAVGNDSADYPETVVVNVHLDHEAPVARVKGAQLVAQRTKEYLAQHNLDPSRVLVVIMGDFNNWANGSPENKAIETDAGLFDALGLNHSNTEGTFHDFTGVAGPTRIDYIYISPHWKTRVSKTEIIRDAEGDETSGLWYPSDHFPVSVELSLRPR
ncbi:hypothetical protein HDU79_004509 [Rhizoclosmatium sp. JEL0117]|nr:hypothetical protein HDU79_004509 [Rhizoclosmatium sp. JEL0117]